jgi:hypothetical protein
LTEIPTLPRRCVRSDPRALGVGVIGTPADIDRIALARKRESIFRPLAKENEKQSLGRGKKGLAKLPDLKPIDTRKEGAKIAGVGERTYDDGCDESAIDSHRDLHRVLHRVCIDDLTDDIP